MATEIFKQTIEELMHNYKELMEDNPEIQYSFKDYKEDYFKQFDLSEEEAEFDLPDEEEDQEN